MVSIRVLGVFLLHFTHVIYVYRLVKLNIGRNETSKHIWSTYVQGAEMLYRTGSVADIPRYMEETGFVNVSVDFIAVTSAPDSVQYDIVTREEFIESSRLIALDAIVLAQNYAPGVWSENEVCRLRALVNRRFDERAKDLHEGKKLWDIAVSMLMIVRGYKPE